MLVKVNDANEGENATIDSLATTDPAIIDESIGEDTGYPFIRRKEDRPNKNSNQNNNQLAIRVECNGFTAEFFGNNYYTSRNFTVFMDKVGVKHVFAR